MSTYFIGDIHGCFNELQLLLKKVLFNHKKDDLWITGDLVSRGPDSLKVLRYLYTLKDRVKIVLGNHDLNLISIYAGIKSNKKENGFDELLSAADSSNLINWLRRQSLLQIDEKRKIIMTHAGVSPQWNISTLKLYACMIHDFLSSKNYSLFLELIYNNNINFWSKKLNRLDRLRYSVNALTRMRYCYLNGRLNMLCKASPNIIHHSLYPWFRMKGNISQEYSIVFGHWSSLRGFDIPKPFFSLDTGCCWGGELTMLRWEDKKRFSQPKIHV
ncbi:MAG: symmetrical bis(5'-nucleosyl)-tetraphosphatase [Buchnera aphidicola (Pentalonia nigronervosa)]|uniref:Bis(5'-nucleosyl)-tetraphosphatase, symmetrical n=1 Tax=Buchnera aphidicola (Pentalonia nigronervosa) TaxID=1309793 RepID=A0A7H1AZG7_9GAMM|nr:MAG: symmetrical bis(5'-nucleosyl)-tetraphosphatase [Buchnera aphidicola (Pentalonia nigronervosa)]